MNRLRIPIILVLLVVVIVGGVMLIFRQNTSSSAVEIILPTPSGEKEVYVSGEVQNPGVYFLNESARVDDAIDAAGGFTTEADQSAVNLAGMLRDGAQIHVYKIGESSARININTAEAWLLEALPGIGPSTAEAIIEYRSTNGPFESIDGVKEVKGIGDSTFEKIADKITVHGCDWFTSVWLGC